jgi:hypothetical protein
MSASTKHGKLMEMQQRQKRKATFRERKEKFHLASAHSASLFLLLTMLLIDTLY